MIIFSLTKPFVFSAWEKGHVVNFSNTEVLAAYDAAYSNEENETNRLKNPIIERDKNNISISHVHRCVTLRNSVVNFKLTDLCHYSSNFQ